MTSWQKGSCYFSAEDLIGQGAFSKVYKNNDISSTSGSIEATAVKVYQKTQANQSIIDHAKRQQSILKNIQSQHVCSYRKSIQSGNRFYMFQKFEQGFTLQQVLRKRLISSQQISNIAKSILQGLQYLHLKRIMHRDLKPANIMYNRQSGKAVILDLGFACYFHKKDQKILTKIVGTPNYMSPQVLTGQKYNSKADIWSFGIILYELLKGQLPFTGNSQKEIVNSIMIKSSSLRISHDSDIQFLIYRCLKVDIQQRISWQQLFDWKNTGKLKRTYNLSSHRIVQNGRQSLSVKKHLRQQSCYTFKNIVSLKQQRNQNCQCLIF